MPVEMIRTVLTKDWGEGITLKNAMLDFSFSKFYTVYRENNFPSGQAVKEHVHNNLSHSN